MSEQPSAHPRPIGILLVDDQPLLRMGFRLVLEAEDDLVVLGEAPDGEAAVRQALALRPDVILMDVRMPRMNADRGDRAHRRGFARVPGHHPHDVRPRRVRVRRPARRRERVPAQGRPARRADRRDPLGSTGDGPDPRLRALTPRELEVLQTVAEGLSNAEIAERFTLSEATVKTHVGRILAKLGLRDRVQAVVLAYESGLATPG